MRVARWSIVLTTLLPVVALADGPKPSAPTPVPTPPAEPATTTPWSKGVSDPNQRRARALFDEGNTLFEQKDLAPALEKYRAAVAIWDHPLIQFNMAVVLIRLDRILEAADALDKALRYQDKPFKPELYQQALDYQALVKGRVGFVDVSCDQQGASVLLDGKRWFDCPGSKRVRVLAGEHTIAGEKKAFLPISRRVVVGGGKTATEKLHLQPLDTSVVLQYPHRRWVPWTITASGAVIALGGLGVWFAGKNQMKAFESNYARDCAAGCEKDLSNHLALRDQRDGAELKGTIGIGMMIGGGAITLGGLVFVLANSPKRILPLEVTPTSGGAKVGIGIQF